MLGPTYFTIDQVKDYLIGKVDFGTDPERQMTDKFLSFICYQSQGKVLMDLNPFYEVPLRSITYGLNLDLQLPAPDYIIQNGIGSVILDWTNKPFNWDYLLGSTILTVKQENASSAFAIVGQSGYQIIINNFTGTGFDIINPVIINYFNAREDLLPSYTKSVLTNLFITKAIFDVLNEDFGQKSAVVNSDMLNQYRDEYRSVLSRLTSKDQKTGQFRYGLLPDLAVNKGNWTGRKVVPRPGVARNGLCVPDNLKYAIRQNTSPSRSWVGGGIGYVNGGSNQGSNGCC